VRDAREFYISIAMTSMCPALSAPFHVPGVESYLALFEFGIWWQYSDIITDTPRIKVFFESAASASLCFKNEANGTAWRSFL